MSEEQRIKELASHLEQNNRLIRRPFEELAHHLTHPKKQEDLEQREEESLEENIVRCIEASIANPSLNIEAEYDIYGEERVEVNSPSSIISTLRPYSGIRPLYAKRKTYNQLMSLFKRNVDILTEILYFELKRMFPEGFRAEYPFCGRDVELINRLPGTWLMIEPVLARKKLSSVWTRKGRICWSDKYPSKSHIDLLFLKLPTPGREYGRVINDYAGRANIIIADTSELPLKRSTFSLNNHGFETETIRDFGGSTAHPLTSFYIYEGK